MAAYCALSALVCTETLVPTFQEYDPLHWMNGGGSFDGDACCNVESRLLCIHLSSSK